MTKAETLLEYLTRKWPQLEEEFEKRSSEWDSDPSQFSTFLSSQLVEESKSHIHLDLPPHIIAELNSLTYPEYVDYSIYLLRMSGLKTQSSRVLPVRQNTLRCKSYAQAQNLRNKEWSKLCDIIGRTRFMEFLCSILCYSKRLGVMLQIMGNAFANRISDQGMINNAGMFYHWKLTEQFQSALGKGSKEVALLIIADSCQPKDQLPKKGKGLLKVLTNACQRELKFDCFQFFLQQVDLCISLDVFDNATSFKIVLRFVLTCLSRVFPDSVFGNSRNKEKINAAIKKYISANRRDSLDISELAAGLNISSIKWIGKTGHITSTHDYLMRVQLLRNFLKWLFNAFICNSIRNFWHVAEVSSSKSHNMSLAFFPHSSWKALTRNWIKSYVENYLDEVTATQKDDQEKILHGRLRVIPKSNDFRPLCVPFNNHGQHSKSNPRTCFDAYKSYDRNVMRPLRDILRTQQLKAGKGECPRSYSLRDVCKHLAKFKCSLGLNSVCQPKLYGFKFDMKHCYDNLNQSMIIELIEELFSRDDDKEEYFVKRITRKGNSKLLHVKSSPLVLNRSAVARLDIEKFPLVGRKHNEIVYEGNSLWRFTKNEVIDLVKEHIMSSTIEVPFEGRKTYKRKRGIFQGNPLLATFCDIVYNRLADHLFGSLANSKESIMLRLADDFLFLSTKEENCRAIFDLAMSSSAHDYGAYINSDKCSWISSDQVSSVHFVGLEIDICNLNFRRFNSMPFKIPPKMQRSLELTISYLHWNFGVRLSDYLVDLNVMSERGVLDNISDVIEPTFDCLAHYLPGNIKSLLERFDKVANFCLDLLGGLTKKLDKVNDDCYCYENVLDKFINLIKCKLSIRIPQITERIMDLTSTSNANTSS